jgi:N-acetylmuramoyl-L-alanine amidase
MISGVPAQCMDSYFYVLKNTWMPAILVECGFMSNRDDLTLLNMAVHRDKVALALAMTIMRSDEKGEF